MANRDAYILTALRSYSDMLYECISDPALSSDERKSFENDAAEVESLLHDYEGRMDVRELVTTLHLHPNTSVRLYHKSETYDINVIWSDDDKCWYIVPR